jgi:hypothetical protein
MNEAITKIMGI